MRIRTFEQLVEAARDRMSLTGALRHRPQPARWVLNMNGGCIHNMLNLGLYVYEPKSRRKPLPLEFQMRMLEQLGGGDPICSCGKKPLIFSSSWNTTYIICINPICARRPCVHGFTGWSSTPTTITAKGQFRALTIRKLLTNTSKINHDQHEYSTPNNQH